MLTDHLREHDRITIDTDDWMIIGMLRSNIRSYISKLYSAIVEDEQKIEDFVPLINQLTPKYVEDCVLELMSNKHDNLSKADISEISEYVACSLPHEIFNALLSVKHLSESSFIKLKETFRSLGDKALMCSFLDFNSQTVQSRLDVGGIHPFLVDKTLNRPSRDDHAVMMLSGAGYTHKKHQFLCYEDIDKSVRFNPFFALLQKKNRRPQRDKSVDYSFVHFEEDKFRHQHYEEGDRFILGEKDLPLIIESFASGLLTMSFTELKNPKTILKQNALYTIISRELKIPLSQRVSPEFSALLNGVKGSNDFDTLNDLVKEKLYGLMTDDEMHRFRYINSGCGTLAGLPENFDKWLELVTDHPLSYQEISRHADQLLNHICEYASFLSVIQKEINHIASKYLAQNRFGQDDITSLCNLFRSAMFTKLDGALEVTDNRALVLYLAECERNAPCSSVQFFRLLSHHCPRQMMADVLQELDGDATESLVKNYLFLSETEETDYFTPLIDIRTTALARFLAVSELAFPCVMRQDNSSFDFERAANKANVPVHIVMDLYHRITNEPKRVALESIQEPTEVSDMSFVTQRISI